MAIPAQAGPHPGDEIGADARAAQDGGGADEQASPSASSKFAAPWSTLDAESKRRRLLEAAEAVFARDGLDAPVPAIAAAAGAGVGSVYRAFASKDDIVAALAVERLTWFTREADAALGEPEAGVALEALLRAIVDRYSTDRVLSQALEAAFERPDVAPIHADAMRACERLLARAAEQGSFRADLTADDVRLVLAGAPAAEASRPGTGNRLLELVLGGLRT
jgi:AcrR family transcriptional regulator